MTTNNVLEYKGYHTKIEFDSSSNVLVGKIEGIRDLINFESQDTESIEKEFHDAVDDYLDFCKEVGKDPNKEYRGTFNVRIDPTLHKKLAAYADKEGKTLNFVVGSAIEAYISKSTKTEIELRKSVTELSNLLIFQHVANNKKWPIAIGQQQTMPFNLTNINMSYQ